MIFYIGTYNDGVVKHEGCENLKEAVRFFSRDVMGHTLNSITDYNYNLLWSIDGGYKPYQSSSIRAIDEVEVSHIIDYLKNSEEELFTFLVEDSKLKTKGYRTGASFTFEDGVFVLKDSEMQPRKMIKISIDVVDIMKHRFNAEYLCENCNRSMLDMEDPTGFCNSI